MKIVELIKKIRDFLFSKANREFLIFLLFFTVAGVFWLLTALNETYEQEVKVPITVTDVPRNIVLTSPETDTIRVTISDKGINLLSYLYGDALKDLKVVFSTYAHSKERGEVPAADLTKMVGMRLAASSKLVSIKPEQLVFYFGDGESKRVPVRWQGTVTPEDTYFISGVEYDPDSVTIFSSKHRLDSINEVSTTVLHSVDFRDTLTLNTRLQKIDGVKMVPERVTIRFMTDILTEERIDGIPVVGINMPQGKVLRTFPAKVSVKFVTGVKNYHQLSPDDFEVVADYNEIMRDARPKCRIYLKRKPASISREELLKEEVDYLIEERTVAEFPSESE